MPKLFYNFVLDSIDCKRYRSINHLLKKTQQKSILELEQWFENRVPGKMAVAVSSGRFGLATLLEFLRGESGDNVANVIIPGFSCVVVSNAVRAAGCEVRYADIENASMNLSLESVEGLVDAHTIAIVVQHVFGVTDRVVIGKIKEKYPSVIIIEDCAHALGGRYSDGGFIGAKGDYAFYSFEQSKMVTAWSGGIVIGERSAVRAVRKAGQRCHPPTLCSNLRLFIKMFSHYWAYRKKASAISRFALRVIAKVFRFESSMDHDELRGYYNPYNHTQFSAAQAACVLEQLKHIEDNVEHRRKLADIYDSMLDSPFDFSKDSAVLRYPILVNNKQEFIRQCIAKGLAVGNWFSSPVHPCSADIAALSYKEGSCPRGEKMANQIVNLPTSLQLNAGDAEQIVRIVLSVAPSLKKRSRECRN